MEPIEWKRAMMTLLFSPHRSILLELYSFFIFLRATAALRSCRWKILGWTRGLYAPAPYWRHLSDKASSCCRSTIESSSIAPCFLWRVNMCAMCDQLAVKRFIKLIIKLQKSTLKSGVYASRRSPKSERDNRMWQTVTYIWKYILFLVGWVWRIRLPKVRKNEYLRQYSTKIWVRCGVYT